MGRLPGTGHAAQTAFMTVLARRCTAGCRRRRCKTGRRRKRIGQWIKVDGRDDVSVSDQEEEDRKRKKTATNVIRR